MSTKISTSKIIKILRRSFWPIFLIFLGVVIFLTYFIYNNIYTAIAQSEEIVILQGQLAIEPVDISLFRGILNKIEEKKLGKDISLENIKNPFLSYE